MLIRAVVGDQVHNHPQAKAVRFSHHDVEVTQRAKERINVAVVADVVSGVPLGGPVEGGQPEGIDTKVRQVRQFLRDPRQVAYAVAVQVTERTGVHLIDHGRAPPSGSSVRGMDERQGTSQGGSALGHSFNRHECQHSGAVNFYENASIPVSWALLIATHAAQERNWNRLHEATSISPAYGTP